MRERISRRLAAHGRVVAASRAPDTAAHAGDRAPVHQSRGSNDDAIPPSAPRAPHERDREYLVGAARRGSMRALVRRVVPWRWRVYLRRVYWWGCRHRCPVCGSGVRLYLPEGLDLPVLRELDVVGGEYWPARVCPVCFVNTRGRLVWFYLEHQTTVLSVPTRLLHVAPEAGIYSRLASAPTVDYHAADLHPENFGFDDVQRVDLACLPHSDASFDVVLANHVLEHVPDEPTALAEIRRVLRPGGWAMLQVPIAHKLERTLDDPTATTPEARERAYGQEDHLRLHGLDYAKLLERSGFRVELYDGHVADGGKPSEAWLLNPRELLTIAWRE